jgi:hypothetical protein
VAIPTTSGTGSEVTPFSVVTDEVTGRKYPLADYALTPTMAIVDPQLTINQPKRLTAWAGVDALTHALESYVSVFASGERERVGKSGRWAEEGRGRELLEGIGRSSKGPGRSPKVLGCLGWGWGGCWRGGGDPGGDSHD